MCVMNVCGVVWWIVVCVCAGPARGLMVDRRRHDSSIRFVDTIRRHDSCCRFRSGDCWLLRVTHLVAFRIPFEVNHDWSFWWDS